MAGIPSQKENGSILVPRVLSNRWIDGIEAKRTDWLRHGRLDDRVFRCHSALLLVQMSSVRKAVHRLLQRFFLSAEEMFSLRTRHRL